MAKYKKNYFKAHCLDECDTVFCEVCGAVAVDIHHIDYKSHGGTDDSENLIALCRHCHEQAHESKLSKEYLRRCKK